MAKKVTELLTDDIVKHSLELQKVGNQLSTKITKELNVLTKELESIVSDNDFSRSMSLAKRKAQLRTVLNKGNAVIADAHSQLSRTVKNELLEVGNLETEFAVGSINKATTGSGTLQIATNTISAARISKVADNLILNGAPQAEMWGRQSRNLQNKFKDVIRTSWANQESIPEVSQRIRGTAAVNYKDGIMATSRHHATSLGRTSIASVANQVREETYLENLDVVEGVEFLAVLDSDTTPICKAHAGDKWIATPDGWKNVEGGHEYRKPPLHFNCRSTLIPTVKTIDQLNADKQKLIPKNKADQMGVPIKPPKSADAWLKNQPVEYQKEVLGKAYGTWKAGKVSFKKFVTQKGRLRSTDELNKLYAKGDLVPTVKALDTTDNFKSYKGASPEFRDQLAKTNKGKFLTLERKLMLGEALTRGEVNKIGLVLKNADPTDLEYKNSYKPTDFKDFLGSKAKRLAFYNHTAKKFERTTAWKKGDLEKRKTSKLNDIDEQVLNQLKQKIADDKLMSPTNKNILLDMFDESQKIVGTQRSLPMIESLFTLARKGDFDDIDDFIAYLSNAQKGAINSYFARAKTFEIRLTSSTEKLARYNMLSDNSKTLFYKDITRSDTVISNRISLAEASEVKKKISTIGKRRLRDFEGEIPTELTTNLELSTPESIELYLAYLNPNTRMSSSEVRKFMKRVRDEKYRDGMTKAEKLHKDRVDFIMKRTNPGDTIVLDDAILNNPLFSEWKDNLWTGRGFPPEIRKQVGEVLGDAETLQGLKHYLRDKIDFKAGADHLAVVNQSVNKYVGEAPLTRSARASAVKKIENLYKLDGEGRAKMRTLREEKSSRKINNEGFFAKQRRKDEKLTSAQKLEQKRELESATWENMVDAKYVGDVRDSLDDLIVKNARNPKNDFYREASTVITDDSVKLSQLVNSQVLASTQKGATYIDTVRKLGEKYYYQFKGVISPDEDQAIRMGHFLTESILKTGSVKRVKTVQSVSKPGYPPRDQLTWMLVVEDSNWEASILANKKNYDIDGLPIIGDKAPKLDKDGLWSNGQASIRGVDKEWVAKEVKKTSSKPWVDNLNIEAGTGIKVNGYIYDVMSELEKKGKSVIPSRPKNKADVVNRSKFDSYMRARNVAKGLRDETFYNRMSNDKFARTYADAVALHWQGDDINRGLMMFNKGQKLGKGGYADFSRNFMNIAGFDKIPMKTRIQLFDKIPDKLILQTAKDPIKYDWWYTQNNWIESGIFKNLNGLDKRDLEEIRKLASKGNPGDEGAFQALAMIKERAEMIEWTKNGNKLEDFVSFLPSQRDGTTNVLQHFAGISRDKSIAESVNMTIQRNVADAYIMLRDSMDDIGRGMAATDPLKKYIDVPGLTHAKRRKSVKKGLMTSQYNAGPQTLGDGYFEALEGVQVNGKYIFKDATSAERLAVGRIMLQAAENQFPEATKVRYLLNNFAEAHEISGAKAIEVKTPLGFPFRQSYVKTETRQIELSMAGTKQKMKLDVRVELDELDYGKQNRAFAPNIIHAMDASHKSLVSNRLYQKYGITDFSMIHDSFGAHFGNMDLLLKETRLAFLEMYEGKNFMRYLFDEFKKNGITMKRFVRNEKGMKIKDGKGGFLTEDIPLSEIEALGDYDFKNFEKLEYFFH